MNPPILKAPSQTQEQQDNKNNNKSNSLIFIIMAVIICVLIIIIIFLLKPPSVSYEKSASDNKEVLINKEVKKTLTKKKLNKLEIKPFNEQIKIEWLLKKNKAESENISIWANQAYKKLLISEEKAEQAIKDINYQEAEIIYQQSIEKVETILSNKKLIMEQLIKEGNEYLEKNELISALEKFNKAASIDVSNNAIKRLLERVSTRKKVLDLINQAAIKQENKKLIIALKLLKDALIIEPEYRITQTKIKQLNVIIKEKNFKQAIDNTLKALDKNKLSTAKKQLEKAKKIDANQSIIEELNERIEVAVKNKNIKIIQDHARKNEKDENWLEASKHYYKLLKIDKNLNNGLLREQRVNAYIRLNKLLDAIILKPERMQNDKILEKSKKSVLYIEAELLNKSSLYYPKFKTPKLMNKIVLAKKLIKEAAVIIDVMLKSDNKTEIAIYKVAQYGKLLEKQIQLRPGKYTIVGSRSGYRDFREVIKILTSDKKRYIRIVCNEKI